VTLAFINNPLDRCANQRRDATWVESARASLGARIVRVHGDSAAITGGTAASSAVFLGQAKDELYWFAEAAETDEGLANVRSLAMQGAMPSEDLSIIAQARSLVHWHMRHRFCANCGAATEAADAGYRRHCGSCNADHFPRTDPVIIMAVTSELGVLLGRQTSWPPGMYSALAGFMEPGETIEDAARREIFEEAGVRVGTVRYAASQPWPYPSSLMIGLIGEALTTEIAIDKEELEIARWFSHDELRLMVAGTHPDKLSASNPIAIARHLIDAAID
jgi:NAD+ diphosphatase